MGPLVPQAYAGIAWRVSRSCFANGEFGAEALDARKRGVAAMRGISSLPFYEIKIGLFRRKLTRQRPVGSAG